MVTEKQIIKPERGDIGDPGSEGIGDGGSAGIGGTDE